MTGQTPAPAISLDDPAAMDDAARREVEANAPAATDAQMAVVLGLLWPGIAAAREQRAATLKGAA